jgi:predicted DNA-binding protein
MMPIKMMKTLQKLIKNNSKVGAIIIKSVDESVYKDIKDLESAHNMIKKLVEIN